MSENSEKKSLNCFLTDKAVPAHSPIRLKYQPFSEAFPDPTWEVMLGRVPLYQGPAYAPSQHPIFAL